MAIFALEVVLLALCRFHFHAHFGQFIGAVILAHYLWVLALIDLRTRLLPDRYTLSLLWLGLIVNSFSIFTTSADSIWGAVLGYGILWSIYQLHRFFTHKEGMGYGDFKLLAALGAWLGWQAIPYILLISASFTLLVFALLRTKHHWHLQSKIPYGPGLAFAGLVMLLVS